MQYILLHREYNCDDGRADQSGHGTAEPELSRKDMNINGSYNVESTQGWEVERIPSADGTEMADDDRTGDDPGRTLQCKLCDYIAKSKE